MSQRNGNMKQGKTAGEGNNFGPKARKKIFDPFSTSNQIRTRFWSWFGSEPAAGSNQTEPAHVFELVRTEPVREPVR